MKSLKILFFFLLVNSFCHAQWVKLSTDTIHYYSAINFLNSDTGFIAGIDWYNSNSVGIILRTTDGGGSWDTTRIDPGIWFMSIQFLNDSVGYAGGQDGLIYKTTDMGDSWQYDFYCASPEDMSNFYFTNLDTCFYQKFNGNLLISDAVNNTCFPTGSFGFSSYYPGTGAIRFIDSNFGYVAGGNGKFAKTTNGGITWNSFNADPAINVLAAYMRNEYHGLLFGENGKFCLTQNGGNTWSIPFSISAHPVLDVMLKDSLFGYAVGGADKFYYGPPLLAPRGIIWKTIDGGFSWSVEDSSWFDQLTAISIVNDSLAFAVGYRGLILRNSSILFSGINNQFLQPLRINVFPNPFSDYLKITVDNNDIVEFKLYDIASRKLIHQKFTQNISFDTKHLDNGVYFYKALDKQGHIRNGCVIKM